MTRCDGPSRRTGSSSKLHTSTKLDRLNSSSNPHDESCENSMGRSNGDEDVEIFANCRDRSKMSVIIQRRCKNVLSKVIKKMDKEGNQIVPLLTELWNKIGSSGFGAGNKLLDLRKIGLRIDKLYYSGVMDFANDVQSMLKSAVQHYGFSHEVQCEARKVRDLFFTILNMSFPEIDFQEAKNSVSITGPTSPSTQAPAAPKSAALSQVRNHKSTNDVDPDMIPLSGQSLRGPPDDCFRPNHPGDLVVCKKKREDREKSIVYTRSGHAGPISPPSMGRRRSPRLVLTPRETRSGRQVCSNPSGQGSGSGGSSGWANPAKRSPAVCKGYL